MRLLSHKTCALAATSCCCAVLAMPASLAAQDDAAPSPVELRLMAGMSPAYEVSEKADSGSASTTYRWEGTEPRAGSFAVQCMHPFATPVPVLGQPLWGLELQASAAKLTPKSYTVDGTSYTNANDESFSYLSFTPTAVLGFRFAEPASAALGLIGEVQFLAGLTALFGESRDQLGSNDKSIGYGFDTGARVLLGLKESGWTGGIVAGVRRGWASIDMDSESTGTTSTYTLDRVGAELTLVIGHSF